MLIKTDLNLKDIDTKKKEEVNEVSDDDENVNVLQQLTKAMEQKIDSQK